MKAHSIGIIGCGWFVPFYAHALPKLADRARVVWVADTVRERAETAAAGLRARPLVDYREGLRDVEAVFILLPHHLHHSVTLDCLRAGLHVLVEKPIALNLTQADEMIAAAERAGRTLMVAYPHRYRRSMQVFKEAITSGRYGKLFLLDAMMDEAVHEYLGGWLAKKETLGGGVFFSSSPHMLDVMLWIAGDVRSVSMAGTRVSGKIEGEDTAVSVIKFQRGVVGVTRHTWASPRSRIWYTMNAWCERAHVTLTTTPVGDLVRDGPNCPWRTRVVALGATEEALHDSDEGLDVGPEIAHFLDCVETGATPQTDGRTARKVIELVLNAYCDADAKHANA